MTIITILIANYSGPSRPISEPVRTQIESPIMGAIPTNIIPQDLTYVPNDVDVSVVTKVIIVVLMYYRHSCDDETLPIILLAQ
jgi:hypothetical protein